MFGSVSIWEILIIILVIALLFGGGKKLSELGRGLGEGIRNFKNSVKGKDDSDSRNEKGH